MEFASPGILGWLLAVPLILLVGLWRTRPVPVTVPSLRLWAKLKERTPPPSGNSAGPPSSSRS
jgi:hypothetical protein